MANRLLKTIYHISCEVFKRPNAKRGLGEDFYLYQRNYQKNIQISNDVGIENHIHILATLPKDKALSDYVRTIKANSSRWIKTLDAHYSKFLWQIGYGAFSVSPSHLNKVIVFIRNQATHHRHHHHSRS